MFMAELIESKKITSEPIPCTEISDPLVLSKIPLVSVHMTTYNHGPYIAQAIEGVLLQRTNFPIELIIGEDCSTDDTRKIVFEYQNEYPDIIRIITSENNVGMIKNGYRITKTCRGKYVAYCEGDDYWIDPLKLQQQVDFLEKHPAYTICFHLAMITCEDPFDARNRQILELNPVQPTYTLDDLLRFGNFIPTCSVVFRKWYTENQPEWLFRARIGDFALHVINAERGKIGFIDKVMSAYRIHSGGVWTSGKGSTNVKIVIELYHLFGTEMNVKRKKSYIYGISNAYFNLAVAYWQEGFKEKAFKACLNCLYYSFPLYTFNMFVKIIIRVLHASLGKVRSFREV